MTETKVDLRKRNKPPARHYDDDTKASALAVLASCGGNCQEASRLTGIPPRTLAYWGDHPTSGAVRAAQPIREQLLANMIEKLMFRLLRSSRGKISGAKLPAVLNGFVHLFDRLQLLKRSTQVGESESVPGINLGNLTSDELRLMRDLIEKAGGSTAGLDDDGEIEVVGADEVLAVEGEEIEDDGKVVGLTNSVPEGM